MQQVDPQHIMRLITAGNRQAVVNLYQKPDINMLVSRPALTGRYGVNVDIKNGIVQQMYVRWIYTAFLGSFAQSHAQDISIAIGVTAGLKPLIMFAMVHHEHALTIRADHPGGSGHMPGQMLSVETIRVDLDKGTCTRDIAGFVQETGGVTG